MEQQRDDCEFNFENLKELSFFKFIGQGEWESLEPNICIYNFNSNENILVEGDENKENHGIYIVSKGSVSVSKTSLNGRDYHVRVLRQGEVFINPGIFDGGPSPATLKAVDETRILYLDRNVVLPIISNSSSNKISEGMYLIIAEIIRTAISAIDDLAFKDSYSRLASLLLNVSRKDIVNRNQFSLQFLSSCINSVPEVVSRGLRKLAEDEVIEITRIKLVIKDRDRLVNIASD